MDLKEIQELIRIVDESKLTAFELEQEGIRIVLKKEAEKITAKETVPAVWPGQYAGAPIPVENYPYPGSGTPASGPVSSELAKPADQQTINSPIVGTFYAAAAPGEEPFVKPNGRVKKGDILCIIEAMKLMNEIEADEDLQIIDVLVKDGQMVEYGQPLFVVRQG